MELKVLPGEFSFYGFADEAQLHQQRVTQQSENPAQPTFVCSVPADYSLMTASHVAVAGFLTAEAEWRCLTIVGQLPFTAIGIAAQITTCLAAAEISVLVFSGFKTDYFFVKSGKLGRAVQVLIEAGYDVAN